MKNAKNADAPERIAVRGEITNPASQSRANKAKLEESAQQADGMSGRASNKNVEEATSTPFIFIFIFSLPGHFGSRNRTDCDARPGEWT